MRADHVRRPCFAPPPQALPVCAAVRHGGLHPDAGRSSPHLPAGENRRRAQTLPSTAHAENPVICRGSRAHSARSGRSALCGSRPAAQAPHHTAAAHVCALRRYSFRARPERTPAYEIRDSGRPYPQPAHCSDGTDGSPHAGIPCAHNQSAA